MQGLRLIKTIIEVKGLKKFKREDASKGLETQSSDFRTTQAREKFRKMTYKSSYAMQFGEPPKAAEAYMVMQKKKFSELDISQYIQPLPK